MSECPWARCRTPSCSQCVSVRVVSRPEEQLVSDGMSADCCVDCVKCSGLKELYINLFLSSFNPNSNIIKWGHFVSSTLKC